MTEVLKENNNLMQWYNGELLHMAVDIADRLIVAFNTSTGIPYPRVILPLLSIVFVILGLKTFMLRSLLVFSRCGYNF